MKAKVRTRFAPSPTGYMHIGNLRTALYEYLIAKSACGDFVLRIEDTDRSRYVDGATEVIYSTLKAVHIDHDEGPDIGGNYGPYVQSERKGEYLKYAQKLVNCGAAYYCFCEKSESDDQYAPSGHADKCRNMDACEVQKLLNEGKNYVIRQKMPTQGETSFEDAVFGTVTVPNKELEDQILIKSDGFPTYNFANVIDDHEMAITHVVRGCEYLSSTPKYNLLYRSLGWDIPTYVHLPLIMGQDENGVVSKLSKRHGAVSFEDLTAMGYLPEAIINYIAFLGWCPVDNREIFSLDELAKEFDVSRISKSPAVFDYKKLDWFNSQYIRLMPDDKFQDASAKYIDKVLCGLNVDRTALARLLKIRISRFDEILSLADFFGVVSEYDLNLFENKKSKTTLKSSLQTLDRITPKLETLSSWNHDALYELMVGEATTNNVKNGAVMWPIRIAVSGKAMTPGGAVEILEILGKEESIKRIKKAMQRLQTHKGE